MSERLKSKEHWTEVRGGITNLLKPWPAKEQEVGFGAKDLVIANGPFQLATTQKGA